MARPICSICHSAYTSECEIQALPECGHVFHGPCVLAWFRSRVGARPVRNAAASCPLCRTEFSAGALLRLRLDFPAAGDLATQHETQRPPADLAAGCCAGERGPVEQASASELLAQALAEAGAATAAAADAARANAALVRDREVLRASLAAEREAARRARADTQAAEVRATMAAKLLSLERSLGGTLSCGDGGTGSAVADADAVYAAAVSALRQTQGSGAASDDVMRALSRAVARGNALNASVREELARAVASAGAALARAAAAEARAAAAETAAREASSRAEPCTSQPHAARLPPPKQTPPVPAPVPPRVFSSLGGIGTGSRNAAPTTFMRGDGTPSSLSDGSAFIRSGADGRGGRHTVLVPLLPLAERRAVSNAQAAPSHVAKRPRSMHGLERFGFSSKSER